MIEVVGWGAAILCAGVVWFMAMGHLTTLRGRNHEVLERMIREGREMVVQVGSGHQRSVLRWSKGGWIDAATTEQPYRMSVGQTSPCLHRRTIDVESVLDPQVILARLCTDCQAQLEPLPSGTALEMMEEATAPERRILFPAFEPECCECEAYHETPEEAAKRPIHVHSPFKIRARP